MEFEQLHVSRLKKGDTASFDYLYNQWSGKLYNFVMRISKGDNYLAEEIVQSVFIKVWENRETLDVNLSFASYICTIGKNLLANIYQHRMTESLYREKLTDKPDLLTENSTEKEIDYHFLDEYINSLIDLLPPARREIFLLSRREFLNNKEIAERLHLSENTVESQLTKANHFLKEKLQRHYHFILALLLHYICK